LDFLESILKLHDIQFYRLDGKTKPEIRQGLVDKFNSKKDPITVFLLGAKAGGAGLNMTGASKMIMLDIDWNPSNEKQVMGRIYRPGKRCIYRLKIQDKLKKCSSIDLWLKDQLKKRFC
jgi:DNA repair and recombination protein RAD54B